MIDLAHLTEQTAGDDDLAREVLDLFAAQCRRQLACIVSADSTPQTARDAAHTLKGAARAVGAWKVAEAAERIEALLRGHQRPGDSDLRSICDACDSACAMIATLMAVQAMAFRHGTPM